MPSSGTLKSNLRKQLRARRRALTVREQGLAAQDFFRHLKRQPFIRRAKRLAFYYANDGELKLNQLMSWSQRSRKQCYLPVIKSFRHRQLLFLPINSATKFRPNHFNIPEPIIPRFKAIPSWHLDAVFFPLVGFDRQGGRLGMGAGYYDVTFSQIKRRPRRPLLIGVGHQCQELESLLVDSWDIPLDAVITDAGVRYVSKRHRNKFIV
jgi:5-formyltetrahydrofolate cyclo-ligase